MTLVIRNLVCIFQTANVGILIFHVIFILFGLMIFLFSLCNLSISGEVYVISENFEFIYVFWIICHPFELITNNLLELLFNLIIKLYFHCDLPLGLKF